MKFCSKNPIITVFVVKCSIYYHHIFLDAKFVRKLMTNYLHCVQLNMGFFRVQFWGLYTFFYIYVNDFTDVSKFETTLLADDTTLHLAHHDFIVLQQQVKEEIENRVPSKKLAINYNKSCYMIISGNKKKIDTNKFNVSISGSLVVKSEYVKYLGVFLDDRLSWKIHNDELSKKLSRACGSLYGLQIKTLSSLSSLKFVYYGLFHSHLEYSLLNWGRAAPSHLQKLIILQIKFIRASLFCAK